MLKWNEELELENHEDRDTEDHMRVEAEATS